MVVFVLGEGDGLPYSCIAVIGPAATDHQVQFCCGHCANGVVMSGQDLGHLCTKDYVEVYKVTYKGKILILRKWLLVSDDSPPSLQRTSLS